MDIIAELEKAILGAGAKDPLDLSGRELADILKGKALIHPGIDKVFDAITNPQLAPNQRKVAVVVVISFGLLLSGALEDHKIDKPIKGDVR